MATTATYLTPDVRPRLRPYVQSVHGYELRGYAPGIHVGLPSPSLTLIVALDDGIDVGRMPRADRSPARFDALVGGLHDGPVEIHHDGTQVGIQLALTPAGARALLGVPAGALASEVVSLEDVVGVEGARVRDRVQDTPHWPDRLALLQRLLADRISDRPGPRSDVVAAWDLLTDPTRPVAVADVARQLGWSRRHLGQLVRVEYGLSPKAIASTARFDRARNLITGRPDLPLADVAAMCGFADQAHMARDWQRFVGRSPTAWLRAEVFPFVQDGAPAAVAR